MGRPIPDNGENSIARSIMQRRQVIRGDVEDRLHEMGFDDPDRSFVENVVDIVDDWVCDRLAQRYDVINPDKGYYRADRCAGVNPVLDDVYSLLDDVSDGISEASGQP